ncbi:MAG: hypothetical protein PHG00_13525, partial [Methylococcales bacterium]|nr:hypothetical protein [Methylococcales bacterium]
AYDSVAQARTLIMQYIDGYNRSRPYSSLDRKRLIKLIPACCHQSKWQRNYRQGFHFKFDERCSKVWGHLCLWSASGSGQRGTISKKLAQLRASRDIQLMTTLKKNMKAQAMDGFDK